MPKSKHPLKKFLVRLDVPLSDLELEEVQSVDEEFLVYSPYYGVLQLVGLPSDDDCMWGTAVWDGEKVSWLVTDTLVPLSVESAILLSSRHS